MLLVVLLPSLVALALVSILVFAFAQALVLTPALALGLRLHDCVARFMSMDWVCAVARTHMPS